MSVADRIAEYHRRYLNVKMLIFPTASRKTLADALNDVHENDVTYLLYRDNNSNPEAALVPWDRYMELLSTEYNQPQEVADGD